MPYRSYSLYLHQGRSFGDVRVQAAAACGDEVNRNLIAGDLGVMCQKAVNPFLHLRKVLGIVRPLIASA